MRLHQKLITNGAMLRMYFDFTEIWKKQRIFLKEIGDIRPDLDPELREWLKSLFIQCAGENGEVVDAPSVLLLEYRDESARERYPKGRETLFHMRQQLAEAVDMEGERLENLAGAVFAVYSLCGVSWDVLDASDIGRLFADACRQPGRVETGKAPAGEDGGCIRLEGSELPYYLPAYDYSCTEGLMARVQYLNTEQPGGRALRLLVMSGQEPLDSFWLRPGESLYVNQLDGRFVEAVPGLAVSSSHCMFYDGCCRYGSVPFALKSYDFEGGEIHAYDFPALEQLTEFTPDDSLGFVGVLRSDGLPMPCSEKPEFRRIYERAGISRVLLGNSTFMLLQKDGRVWSNLKEANSWRGMVRIFLSQDGEEAIGVRRDGTVVSTDKERCVHGLDRMYQAVFCKEQLAARLPGGGLKLQGFLSDTGVQPKEVKAVGMGMGRLWLLLTNGELLENGRRLASHVKEFAGQDQNLAWLDENNRLTVLTGGKIVLDGTN